MMDSVATGNRYIDTLHRRQHERSAKVTKVARPEPRELPHSTAPTGSITAGRGNVQLAYADAFCQLQRLYALTSHYRYSPHADLTFTANRLVTRYMSIWRQQYLQTTHKQCDACTVVLA
jgi:hypothetical protein